MGFLDARIGRLEQQRNGLWDTADELCEMDVWLQSGEADASAIRVDNKIRRLKFLKKAVKRVTFGVVK